jgi:hypothetical protein
MNAAGRSLVSNKAIGLIKAESGGLTIPGLPDISTLGSLLGGAGPSLSSINFSYGGNGISTNYVFKTFSPKFGSLNKQYIEKFKEIAKNRQEQIRFIRNIQITQNKISSKIKKNAALNKPEPKNNRGGPSLQRIMVGEVYDWGNGSSDTTMNVGRTVVGISTLDKSSTEMLDAYESKAYMSLDGLFGPLSLKGDGGLPRYIFPLLENDTSNTSHKSSPWSPQPPFDSQGICETTGIQYDTYNLNLTQKYFNPLTNNISNGTQQQPPEHHHDGPGDGHVIDLVGRNNEVPENGLITNFYDKNDNNNRYSEDYRFLGLRGPLVLHSWGYDLDGKPVPNEIDSEESTKNGEFKIKMGSNNCGIESRCGAASLLFI